jgi:hypothetical protein
MALALVLTAAVMGITLAIAVLMVSVASRLEDSARSLAGPPPGLVRAAARTIVGFHCEGIVWLQPRPERTRSKASAVR